MNPNSGALATIEQIRDWLFNLNSPTQKAIWAAVVILLGYVLGVALARILTFTGQRLSGLAHRKDVKAEEKSADHMLFDILGSVIKGLMLVGSVAVAADIIGVFHIEDAREFAIATAKGIAILVGVWFIGGWMSSRVRKFGETVGKRTNNPGSTTMFAFLSSLVRFGALAIGVIAALQQFGFPIASLVAVIGAAGLAIALALQDTLKAVAAGFIIAVFRPYRIGDVVKIAGQDGTVADITPFTTVLNTIDNREIVITNDKAWGDVIINSSARAQRRIDLTFSIDYEDDIDTAINIIRGVLKADERVLQDKGIWVKVWELAASSVDIKARAWCANGDWFDLKFDTLKKVKQGFDAAGVSIPYPHQMQVVKHPEQLAPPATQNPGKQPSGADNSG